MRIANDLVYQFVMPPMHAIEYADGNRRGAQASAIIKCIGGNDASLIRLAREKKKYAQARGRPASSNTADRLRKDVLHNKATALDTGERLEPAIEHQRKTAPSTHRSPQARAQ